MIKQWFGVSRKVYNMTVERLKDESVKPSWQTIKTGLIHSLPEWAKTIPYQIKSLAVSDACDSVRECRRRTKQSGEEHLAHFRSRHDPQQSCYIPKSAISERGAYHTILGELRLSEEIPEEFGDCRLVAQNGRYYLAVPEKLSPQHTDNQGRVVALDPGIRSFITLFSENSYGWIGKADIGRIQRLCSHLDNLYSRSAKAAANQRYRMRKAQARMRNKIRDLIDELHHKVAHFLVQNYDVILLPTFESSEMVVRSARRINSKTARSMLNFAHYRFRQFLKHKAFEYSKVVIDVCEAYTSKTVSWTGEIIAKLGGRKHIKSSVDGRTMDRDMNGARGIMLRALVDTPSLLAEHA